ncbi:cytochrome P450 family 71 subfamily B polypeptide 7 [Euphorbia peplus]|nr:putative cytochrome P450 monooxygenase [Euphorbia peplus]WCJ37133.1 cytochrome P450 family 71 subfamily B polypeptide 7 [Euphorbia peplus]
MESHFASSEWAVMTILTLIFLTLILKKLKNPTQNLPPGAWRLPIIGSMHHLIGCLPHQKMRDLAVKHGPIIHLKLGEVTNIVISSPEAAEKVLKTHGLIFSQRPQMSGARCISYDYKDITFSPYGDYWRQLRKITTMELLAAKRVESFRSIRDEETSKLIESILLVSCSERCSGINLMKMITSLTYCITSRAVYGKVLEGEDVFVTCLEKIMMELGRGISIADAYPSMKWLERFSGINIRIEKLHQQLDETVEGILSQHRSARLRKINGGDDSDQKEDLVDVLLNLQEKGDLQIPLTDDTIKALILDIFSAGVDTSAATLEWTMSELMKNPKIMEKAQREIRERYNARGRVEESELHELKYLKLVIKESLRLHPPVPLLIPRECTESCVIDGYDIPVKSRIMVNAWAMGRDPKYWEDAEEFKPERFVDSSFDFRGSKFEYLPFGAGRRSCPGILFGLANVDLPLAKLLYHFDWKIADEVEPENLDMSEEIGITTKRKFNLCIIPTLYNPPC